MKPILSTQLFLVLFLLIITLLFDAGNSLPIYTPVEDITLKCGYSGNIFNEYDNRNWSGDINSKFSPIEEPGNTSMCTEAPYSFSVHQVSYNTARLSHSEFTYSFHLIAGQKFVRLYFYPVSYGPNYDRSKALFTVKAGGFILLHDFNTSVTADASRLETIYREFCLNIESEQSLNITFTPSRANPDAYAFVNAIEIVSMPTNLYYTPSQSYGVEYVSNENNFRIENNTALETVYRINIGGKPVFFNEDTGMYRNWNGLTDEARYLEDLSVSLSVLPQNVSLEPNFSTIPEYAAPKQVYQTGRSMGMNKTINKSYNLTWQFPVDSKFFYLLRLHFCEFEPDITQYGDRLFLIYIANLTAEYKADIIGWSGGNARPVYKDYCVYIPEAGHVGSHKKVNLSLALQANPNDRLTNYNDALLNGLEIFKLNNSVIILAGTNPPPLKASLQVEHNRSRPPMQLTIVGSVLISTTLVLLSIYGLLVLLRRWKVKEFDHSSHRTTNSTNTHLPSDLCRYFSLTEIKAATQNFDGTFIIGAGGFGHVYKGFIDGGGIPVAIKLLKTESSQGEREFKTEIEMLSQLRHRHLVSLIGYCGDEAEMILVYDFMSRGTLSDHLYHTKNPSLSWEQRLEICIGAARGLHYLHTGAKCIIIHRDVKSTNILLDEKWVAKISDFGLSKTSTTTMSNTYISTVVKGSFGYMDPEYYRRQQLTEKSDVYSFGVVLCEVLCARPAVVRTCEDNRHMSLAKLVQTSHRNKELDQIIDPCLKGMIRTECLNKFIEITVSCMHENGTKRPSMYEVVRGLQFALRLQNLTEYDMVNIDNIERRGEDELTFIQDREGFSSSEQSSATNESIKWISKTIFSEINNPDGR